MFPAFFCAIAYRRAQDTLQKRRGFDVFWNTMYGPPQYSHVLNAVVSHTKGLACCRAYLLRHFCEQNMRRRPRPFLSGMAFPQFGQKPITLMLFASISSTMLSSHTNRVFPGSEISRNHDLYWFRCQGQHFDNFPHLIPLSAIIKPANSQSKHCHRFSNKILSSAFCSDLWYNDKHRTLLSPSFTN